MASGTPGKRRLVRLMALMLLLFPGGGAPASESPPAAVSDARLFTREFREKGALRFYEATEEDLRLGRFEAAFLRYRFLKARVGGDPAYRPLVAMVDHRLRFLAGQMGLAGVEVPPLRAGSARPPRAAPESPRRRQEPAAEPAVKPETPQTAPAAPESPASPPPAPAVRPPAEASPAAGSPAPEAVPPAATEQQKFSASEPAEQKPGPEPPAPSPSRWQRLKARLFFWRK